VLQPPCDAAGLLDDFAKACGWKNNPKSIKLPTT
jgi:hypothetical protein